MNFLETHCFSPHRICLSLTGLWPYTKTKWKLIGTLLINFILINIPISLILNVICISVEHYNIKLISAILWYFLIYLYYALSYYNNFFKLSKIRKLLTRINRDWCERGGTKEFKIMKQYAEESRIYMILMIIINYASLSANVFIPATPFILDIFYPLNETRPRLFPFPVKFLIDTQKYYYFLLIITYISVSLLLLAGISHYAFCLSFVQHACGMYMVVGNMLENLFDDKKFDNSKLEDESYPKIVQSIKYHKEALKFSADLNSLYETTYFFMLILGPFLMGCGFIQILQDDAFTIENLAGSIVITINIICNLIVIYWNCYLGQKIIDHSVLLIDKAYSTPWYMLSLRSQILFKFIIMRSMRTSYLSLGKFSILSVKFFASLIQTALSYATVHRNITVNKPYFWGHIFLRHQINRHNSFKLPNVLLPHRDILQQLLQPVEIILQINNLLERIQRDWYNKEVIYLTSIIGISLISIFPVFLDIINPLNETRYRELPYPVVDFIDQQKYFYHLSMLSFMVVLDMSFCGIANYALIAIFIQYMCGMFSVVGNMLENALDSKLIKSDDPNKEAKIYAKIVHSIKYHKEALKFDADFNALFETTYLIMLICAPILVTLGFVRDDAFETKNQMETIHSLINVLCNLFFVYGNCYLGQKVIDQSVFVFDKAFDVRNTRVLFIDSAYHGTCFLKDHKF
ncbi:odorant receptor 4-like [Vespula maculifrons]|uniref:Odorant receptor 4-like n=1 Tax=Vespula maculifrons TaxID=7453 RepID=A0ABD2CVB9_VESMC